MIRHSAVVGRRTSSYSSLQLNRSVDWSKIKMALAIFSSLLITIIVVVVSAVGSPIQENKEICHSTFEKAIEYFATKTPYIPQTFSQPITPEDCTAEQIWILNRHGTRYPGDDDIVDMLTVLPSIRDLIVNASAEGQGNLCPEEIERLKLWTPNPSLNVSQESWLVDQGRKELLGLGQRWRERFPQLFPEKFSNESYYFRSTKEERTIESAISFATAIFGAESLPDVYFPEPIVNDPILYFYKNCDKWSQQVDDNPNALYESDRFAASPVFQIVLTNVNERLFGNETLRKNQSLSRKDVERMYMTCTFETAWEPEVLSPWCSVFSEEDFKVLEYQEDLEDYWMDGFAFPITYEQACMPVKDLLDRFSLGVNGDIKSELLTTAYFAHSGTLLKFYARLGLFKDVDNLTSDAFPQFSASRQWRTGKIGTFASNIAFTLFHCPNRPGPEEYQIGTLVQETPASVPACDNSWICSYEKFAQSFQNIANTCNLEEICKV